MYPCSIIDILAFLSHHVNFDSGTVNPVSVQNFAPLLAAKPPIHRQPTAVSFFFLFSAEWSDLVKSIIYHVGRLCLFFSGPNVL